MFDSVSIVFYSLISVCVLNVLLLMCVVRLSVWFYIVVVVSVLLLVCSSVDV